MLIERRETFMMGCGSNGCSPAQASEPTRAPARGPRTMSTSHPRVWAVGDVTQIAMANGVPFPKAGVFAEGQGRAAAAAIVADVTGSPPATTFDGKVYCFVETGDGKASAIVGDFLTSPAPTVNVLSPNEDNYRNKIAFERDRLATWFS